MRFRHGYYNPTDIDIIEKTKYLINMDIGTMIDWEWVESLKGVQDETIRSRYELIIDFIDYYQPYIRQT